MCCRRGERDPDCGIADAGEHSDGNPGAAHRTQACRRVLVNTKQIGMPQCAMLTTSRSLFALTLALALTQTSPALPTRLWIDATADTIGETKEWTNKVEIADLNGDGLPDL